MQASKELWFIGTSLEDQNYANEVVTSHSLFSSLPLFCASYTGYQCP